MELNIKCNIQLVGFNNKALIQNILQIKEKLEKERLKQIKVNSLPRKKKKITILNSPHVHKKAREQFELNIYKQQITFVGDKLEIKKFLSLFKNEFVKDDSYFISLKK